MNIKRSAYCHLAYDDNSEMVCDKCRKLRPSANSGKASSMETTDGKWQMTDDSIAQKSGIPATRTGYRTWDSIDHVVISHGALGVVHKTKVSRQ